MRRSTNLMLTILAMLVLSNSGAAQSVQKKVSREVGKTGPSPVSVKSEAAASTRDGAVVSKRLERGSPELEQVFADKKFLDACTTLVTSGEMFLIESGQIAKDGAAFAVTFSVVDEVTKEPGQYKQLVYAFDGKDAFAYFVDQNPNYRPVKSTSGAASKIKLPAWPPTWTPPKWTPPSWWPGSGGGSVGAGGGFEWSDWQQVSVECHPNLICPFIHQGRMRQEERASKSNPTIKQSRWILINCGC